MCLRPIVRPLAVAALGAGLLLVLPELSFARERLWAFVAVYHIPPEGRWLLVLGLVGLTVGGERLLAACAHLSRAVWLLVAGAGLAALVVLRQRNFELGDSELLIQLLTRFVHLDGFHVSFDEPLELYFHSLAYRWTHALFDWSVADAYVALSCLGGLVYALAVVRLWRCLTPSAPARIAGVALMFCTPGVQLFFGYVENYTLTVAATLVYVLLARWFLERRVSLWVPALCLGLAISLHVMAGWLLPSLTYLWWARDRTTRWAGLPATLAALLAVPVATLGWLSLRGFGLEQLGETHLAAMKFVFLIESSSPYYRFAFFSQEHLLAQANQLLLVGLPGLLVLVWLAVAQRDRLRTPDPFVGFLVVATFFVQLFASTWNPEIGAARDWDLFAIAGFFWTLLAAVLLLRGAPGARELRVGVAIIGICGILAGSWVIHNHLRATDVDALHGDAHLRLARRMIQAGDTNAARRQLEDAIRVQPDHAEALMALASMNWNAGQPETARQLLTRYLEEHGDAAEVSRVRRLLETLERR